MINISNKVKHEIISCIITDTSLSGYSIGDSNNSSRGLWYTNEVMHIIVLQLKVVKTGAYKYLTVRGLVDVRVTCNITATICYINNMGCIKLET